MPHALLRYARCIFPVLLMAALVACSPIDRLKRAQEHDSGSFRSNLAAEYLAFAQSEKELGEQQTSDHFARKGLLAAQGQPMPPEHPGDWQMDAETRQQLAAARERLMAVRTDALQRIASQRVARAQLLFDCQVVQAHQQQGDDSTLPCRSEFLSELEELEHITHTLGARPKVSLPADYTILFPVGGTHLGKDADFTVQEVLAITRLFPEHRILVTGHADRAGSAERNLLLSQLRAEHAAAALIEAGVDAVRIQTSADGEDNPAEPTLDGVYRQRNRRVEISVLPVMPLPAAVPAPITEDGGRV